MTGRYVSDRVSMRAAIPHGPAAGDIAGASSVGERPSDNDADNTQAPASSIAGTALPVGESVEVLVVAGADMVIGATAPWTSGPTRACRAMANTVVT